VEGVILVDNTAIEGRSVITEVGMCLSKDLIFRTSEFDPRSQASHANQLIDFPGYEQLSDRQIQVLELMILRKSYKAISEQIDISINTVKTHAERVFSKLAVKDRQELQELFIHRMSSSTAGTS